MPSRRSARDSNPFDEPAGLRRPKLEKMEHDDFEELVHRLVRVAFPSATHTGNPDSGADTLLPLEGGAWARAWQARRYGTGRVHWRACEKALDDAVATYGVEWYTFVFAHDLSDKQTVRFNQRLARRKPGVRVDYWNLSEVLAQLDESAFGQRIARLFFGPSREEYEAAMRDAFAAGAAELKGADDVLGRLKAVASWLERNDPHFAYETHTWEVGQPEAARTPGIVMSHIEVDERTGRRIDARVRDRADDEAPLPELRVDFDLDERGRRAQALLHDAERRNVGVKLSDGFSVTFSQLPDLWADQEDEPMRDVTLVLQPGLPRTRLIEGVLRAITDDGPVTLDIKLDPVVREEWHLSWSGSAGGLTAEFRLRPADEGGYQGMLNLRYELPEHGSARREREAVAFALAAGAATTIEIVPTGRPPLTFPIRDPFSAEHLHAVAEVLDAIVEIEQWTGERIPLPAEFDEATAQTLLNAARMIRDGGFTGTVAGNRYTLADRIDPEQVRKDGFKLSLQQEYGIEINGTTIWLGVMSYDLVDIDWTIELDGAGRTVLVVPPDDGKVREGQLLRGTLPRRSDR